jgi:hypothetical protein
VLGLVSYQGFDIPLDENVLIKWTALLLAAAAASMAFAWARLLVTRVVGQRRITRSVVLSGARTVDVRHMRFQQRVWPLGLLLAVAIWCSGGLIARGLWGWGVSSAIAARAADVTVVLFIAAGLLGLLGTMKTLTFNQVDGQWVCHFTRKIAFVRVSSETWPLGERDRLIEQKVLPNMSLLPLVQLFYIGVGLLLVVCLIGIFLIIAGLTVRRRAQSYVMYAALFQKEELKRPFRLSRALTPSGLAWAPPPKVKEVLRSLSTLLPNLACEKRSKEGLAGYV